MAGYFLTGSCSDAEIAPQKVNRYSVFSEAARVKRRCKRPPVSLVTEIARKALSGAMPNRKAMMLPASLSGRQLELFCEKQSR